MVTERRRPGRRPGSADTRGEILAAARKVFAENGFDKATVRGIAREAGVDPALVHHYFDTKEGLFVAAMRLPLEPAAVLAQVLPGPIEQVGERLVRAILTLTADERSREPLLGLMRSAMTSGQGVAMIREFLSRAIFARAAAALDVPPIRIEAAFAQLLGVVQLRYIVKLEPLASADLEELVELLAPTVQRYLVPRP